MSIGPPEKFAFLPPILTGCRTCLDTHSARPRCAAETAPGRTQDPGSPPPRLSPACCGDCSPTPAWPLRRAVSASRSRDCRRWLVAHPEALIYEPVVNKRRLVGVEYIVDAATWLKTTTRSAGSRRPCLPIRWRSEPLQFGPFFELHVWAWRGNARARS